MPVSLTVANFAFLLLGIGIGTLGTLIGAGGGFILIPLLMYLFPAFSALKISSLGMITVAANATSGSVSYLIQRKVQFVAALLFTLAALPGAWIGVLLVKVVDRMLFDFLFGGLLVSIGAFLLVRHSKADATAKPQNFVLSKNRLMVGFVLSFLVGLIASFAGIGGGIIHVPVMIELLAFPVHLAAGTSHFILAMTALFTVAVHWSHGDYADLHKLVFVPFLVAGVLIGAQLGARLAKRVRGQRILQGLAVALIMVGIRLLWHSRNFFSTP